MGLQHCPEISRLWLLIGTSAWIMGPDVASGSVSAPRWPVSHLAPGTAQVTASCAMVLQHCPRLRAGNTLWQELGWGSSCCCFRRGWCSPPPPLVHGAIGSEAAELTVPAGHSLRGWWAFALAWPVHLLGFPPSSSATRAAGVASRTEWKGWNPAAAGAEGAFPKPLQLRTSHKELNALWNGGSSVLPHTRPWPMARSPALGLWHRRGSVTSARSDSRAEGVCCLQDLAWPLALSFCVHSLLH